MNTIKVFVYGTLKRGQPNHRLLEKPVKGFAHFIQTAVTIEKFPLVIATKFNIPYLLNVSGIGERVAGEIYDVDNTVLATLDRLEGHPDYYTREVIALEGLEDKSTIVGRVFGYLLPQGRFPQHLLSYPKLSSYDSFGAHGRRYISSQSNDEEVSDADLSVSWHRHKLS